MSISAAEARVKRDRLALKKFGASGRSREDKIKSIMSSYFKNLEMPEEVPLDQWLDKHYYLPSESASEHGRWVTDRFPFHRKLCYKLSPMSYAREIGISKGSQLGISTIGVGWSMYIADQGLGPTLITQPTKDAVTEFVEQKMEPSIAVCKKVKDSLGENKPKYLPNTKLRKGFPGGFLSFVSAGSPTSLRSKSIRNLVIDEEDALSTDLAGEGSAPQLAIRRVANFPDHKIFRISTPVLKETSSIEPYCNTGTAERYLVPCPSCNPNLDKYGTYFQIKWENISWEGRDYSTAQLACPSCGELHDEHHKTWMLENAFWYRYNPTPIKGMQDDERRYQILVALEKEGYYNLSEDEIDYLEMTSIDDEMEKVCTFFISALYSPLGFFSWAEAARLFIQATDRNDHSLIKTFVNTVLGESYANEDGTIDVRGIEARKELYSPYGDFEIPMGGLVVTMGVDVQKDRLEATIIATGEHDEEWLVDYKVFYGETKNLGDGRYFHKGQLTCWGHLREFLDTTYMHQSGHKLPIECTMIDARYNSPEVFAFCRDLETKRIYPVYGTAGWGKGYLERPQRRNKYGVLPFKGFTDELKVLLYSQLRNETPGPRYVHFSRTIDYPKKYFKGLTIEELKTKELKGGSELYWYNPPGGRNEPLDTYCYAKVAFLALALSIDNRKQALTQPAVLQKKAKSKGRRQVVRRKKKAE